VTQASRCGQALVDGHPKAAARVMVIAVAVGRT
jgi:hypothetical protein